MLYIIGTPIGNLKEITYRAVEVLRGVDLILAEDTRHSSILFKTYDITAPCVSYQKFNERGRCAEVIERLKNGENIALISDAGMPLVSDPGSILVAELIKNGLDYTVISGACAAINAGILSGLDLSSFCMAGFLPEKNIDREKYVARFSELSCTLIFYVSPHSIDDDIAFLYKALGARRAALAREISKIYEQVVHFTLGDDVQFTHKGEFVIVIEGAAEKSQALSELSIREHYERYLAEGMDKKEAMKKVASDRNIAKSIVYKEVTDQNSNSFNIEE